MNHANDNLFQDCMEAFIQCYITHSHAVELL